MVKFLLQRPIAVLMAFTAFFIIGLVTYFTLPVSLLPDIAIPQITVQVSGDNTSARELENTVVAPVRRQLLQVAGLRQISSEIRDGAGVIRMEFDFGVNTDLAFIEVNEKIDAVMNYLPKEIARPKAIKASATDIPVLYLNMTLKGDRPYSATNEKEFLDMCNLAENVVKRRIEQLPEVAMADISIEDIENALSSNNVEPGSMLVRDGYYEYNIRISSMLRTADDVKNIFIRKGERMMQLKDLCSVDITTQKETGRSLFNGRRAVTLAVIKQSNENMDRMKEKLSETTDYLSSVYPDVEFSVSRNQTDLLDYTISNLQQNLSLGFLLIFIVAVLFLGDVRSPLLIGISMVTSIVITFFLFYLCHISLNVISLSGLILAVGMMIDSAIIVTENISQYREKGYSLKRSCAIGTTEMITPMLSSSLTTIAVFVPLIFMSGIAGAIFMDQAFSITAGLMISYITGIMLVPVLYLIFYRTGIRRKGFLNVRFDNIFRNEWLERFYDNGCNWVFSHKTVCMITTAVTIPLCVLLFVIMQKSRMPEIDYNELVARVEWNENINVEENNRRVEKIEEQIYSMVREHSASIGVQDYILDGGNDMSSSECELYFRTGNPDEIAPLKKKIENGIHGSYPLAKVTFSPPQTIFEKLFVTAQADIVAQLHTSDRSRAPEAQELRKLEGEISRTAGVTAEEIAFSNQLGIIVDRERLLLYAVSYDEVTRTIRTAFIPAVPSYKHSG